MPYERKKKKYKCNHCKCIFESYKPDPRYCSRECVHEGLKHQIVLRCDGCGILFERIPAKTYVSQRHYCTRECYLNVIRQGMQMQMEIAKSIFDLGKALDFSPKVEYTEENENGENSG